MTSIQKFGGCTDTAIGAVPGHLSNHNTSIHSKINTTCNNDYHDEEKCNT